MGLSLFLPLSDFNSMWDSMSQANAPEFTGRLRPPAQSSSRPTGHPAPIRPTWSPPLTSPAGHWADLTPTLTHQLGVPCNDLVIRPALIWLTTSSTRPHRWLPPGQANRPDNFELAGLRHILLSGVPIIQQIPLEVQY
jgi:hypothetical protein